MSQLVSLLSKTCSKLEESCECSFESLCYDDLVFFMELFFTFDGHGSVTIHSEYYLKEKSIVFQRGSLLDAYDEYHELVNPFVMKKEIKKKVYID